MMQLSQLVREATQPEHNAAEEVPFTSLLLDGKLGLPDYARLAVQHRALYGVLEEAVAQNADPAIAPLLDPALSRVGALDADLEFLGVDWRAGVLPATQEYCDHLRSECFVSPYKLMAHHYVRYLGDLSGGQIVRAKVQRHYGLTGSEGTAFYRFEAIDSPKRFKDRYRAGLDGLLWDAAEREVFIAEAKHSFVLNGNILRDLGRAVSLV